MRFDQILGRLTPKAKFDFKTTTQTILSRKPGDSQPKEVEEEVRIYDDYDAIIWNDTVITQPTPEECEIEWGKIIAEENLEVVHEKRREAYGTAGDQLDMIYWDRINGTNIWQEMITGIKEEYPKG